MAARPTPPEACKTVEQRLAYSRFLRLNATSRELRAAITAWHGRYVHPTNVTMCRLAADYALQATDSGGVVLIDHNLYSSLEMQFGTGTVPDRRYTTAHHG